MRLPATGKELFENVIERVADRYSYYDYRDEDDVIDILNIITRAHNTADTPYPALLRFMAERVDEKVYEDLEEYLADILNDFTYEFVHVDDVPWLFCENCEALDEELRKAASTIEKVFGFACSHFEELLRDTLLNEILSKLPDEQRETLTEQIVGAAMNLIDTEIAPCCEADFIRDPDALVRAYDLKRESALAPR